MATDLDTIIQAARDAHSAAALARWEKDGQRDCGSCGGYLLTLDGRGAVAKRMLETGAGYRSGTGVTVCFPLPESIRSQNEAIPQDAGRAARAVFEAAGVRITEARAYVD